MQPVVCPSTFKKKIFFPNCHFEALTSRLTIDDSAARLFSLDHTRQNFSVSHASEMTYVIVKDGP